MIAVRRIRPGEADALRLVRLAALAESPSAFGSSHADESALTSDDWIARARAGSHGRARATFFAVDDEHVVGIAGGYRLDTAPDVVELVSMWTDPGARRAGVGRLLVGAVLEWARASGAGEVQLWVTRGNTAAEILYRTVGFIETGDCQPLPSDPCKDETRMAISVRPAPAGNPRETAEGLGTPEG